MNDNYPYTISMVLEFDDIASGCRMTIWYYLDGLVEVYSGRVFVLVDQL